MKKITIFISLLLISISAFAMPTFKSFVPDTSGEFVFYRDSSFKRESYVGILYYDDSTFEIRYYAPVYKDEETLLPEKDLTLLITVKPDNPFWEMTGERILGTVLPGTDDAELVNYMHDLLYEFSSRRSKTEVISPENQKSESIFTDFVQFGGNSKINYDCLVPLFNIRSIENEKGEKVFDCITFGSLKDSSDTIFSDFKGFSNINQKASKSYKKSKAKNISYETQQISVDENWIQQMENIWTLNDDSFITLSIIPSVSTNDSLAAQFVTRKLLLSTQGTYTDFANSIVIEKNNQIKIISDSFQPASGKSIHNVKILSKKSDNSFDYFSIATYSNAYKANQAYYEKIIKSYRN